MIQRPVDLGSGQQRFDLGRQPKPIARERVVKGLFSSTIARRQQRTTPAVPERQREHAADSLQEALAVFLVSVNQHLDVGLRAELVSASDELALDFLKVVDLAVRHQLNRAVLVGERLLAAREIDDRQPPHRQADARQHDAPLFIGSPMVQRPHHSLDLVYRNRALESRSTMPTIPHISACQLVSRCESRRSRTTRAGTPAAM